MAKALTGKKRMQMCSRLFKILRGDIVVQLVVFTGEDEIAFEAEIKGFNETKVYNNLIRYGYQLKNDESLNKSFLDGFNKDADTEYTGKLIRN